MGEIFTGFANVGWKQANTTFMSTGKTATAKANRCENMLADQSFIYKLKDGLTIYENNS